jgi:hypothetical protein
VEQHLVQHAPLLLMAVLGGAAVAAAAGLRAFLPLFVLGLASRFGIVHLAHGAAWMASEPALVCLGTATLLEIAGDKIPAVDHALDFVGTIVRPAAAAVGAYGMLVGWPAPWAQLIALLLGTGAFAMNLAKAKLRLGSSAVSLGAANPVLSVLEDVVSIGMLLVGLLAPLLILVLLVAAAWAWSRRMSRAPAAVERPPATPAPPVTPKPRERLEG